MPKPDVDVGNFNLAGLVDVLTMRMPHMRVVIDAMKEQGLRDDALLRRDHRLRRQNKC